MSKLIETAKNVKDFVEGNIPKARALALATGLGVAALAHNVMPQEEVSAPKVPETAVAQPATPVEKAPTAPVVDQNQIIADKLTSVAVKDKRDSTSKAELRANMKTVVDAFAERGMTSPRVLAYAAATMEHETAHEFKPIEEYGGRQQAITLGYGGGADYFGRGYVQLTHIDNYAKVGKDIGLGDILVKEPEKALEPPVAADVMADFFATHGVADDAEHGSFEDARQGVNGTDRADLVAGYADQYLEALHS